MSFQRYIGNKNSTTNYITNDNLIAADIKPLTGKLNRELFDPGTYTCN